MGEPAGRRPAGRGPTGVIRRVVDLLPQPLGGSPLGKARACMGALLGLFTTAVASQVGGFDHALSLLIPPLGASAVILFALPASPLAQPWSLVGGNVTAALVGVTCAHVIADPLVAAPIAVAAAIAAMYTLRCLHPPGGAVALTAVIGGPAVKAMGYGFALVPVGLASTALLATGLVFHNLTRHRYPRTSTSSHAGTHATTDPPPIDRLGFTPADLDAVLSRHEALDVTRADLEEILAETQLQAYRRHLGGLQCADIMSRDVVRVTRHATLAEAWALLREHRIKALPVVDSAGWVIGIVTAANFAEHGAVPLRQAWTAGLKRRLRRMARRSPAPPETVDRIMSSPVQTVEVHQSIADLCPLMADQGHHHIPVRDADGLLAGMITQSDLIAAIYRRGLVGAAIG